MKKLSINTAVNVLTKLWNLFSIYFFVPLYIGILGEETYGLVSFFATLQMAMNLLGLGLGNTLRREFAAGENVLENKKKKYQLLRGIELVYCIVSIVIIILCACGSDFISKKWLILGNLDPFMVQQVIALMGISIALQLMANLYLGGLFGLDKQVLANICCIVWSALKNIGVLIVLQFSKSLVYFYEWHILIDLLYMILLRIFVVNKLNIPKENRKWSFKELKNLRGIVKYTIGILTISLVALVNKELDKIIISKYLGLAEIGAYNIATTLGNLTTIIPAAVYTSVFPVFVQYATTGNDKMLQQSFIQINKIVNIVLSCMTAYIAVFSLQLIKIWTGSDLYVALLGFVGTLVVLAVGLIEFQEIPFALALANGNTKTNVFVGVAFLPIVSVLTLIGIKQYGLVGAGFTYLVMMFAQTILYVILIYRKYISKSAVRYVLLNIVVPLLFCTFIALIEKHILELFVSNLEMQVFLAIVFGAISLAVLLYVFAKHEIQELLIRRNSK